MAVGLEVAFDDLMAAFTQFKESFLYEQQKTNNRLDYIETETMITKETVKSAAEMILKNLG